MDSCSKSIHFPPVSLPQSQLSSTGTRLKNNSHFKLFRKNPHGRKIPTFPTLIQPEDSFRYLPRPLTTKTRLTSQTPQFHLLTPDSEVHQTLAGNSSEICRVFIFQSSFSTYIFEGFTIPDSFRLSKLIHTLTYVYIDGGLSSSVSQLSTSYKDTCEMCILNTAATFSSPIQTLSTPSLLKQDDPNRPSPWKHTAVYIPLEMSQLNRDIKQAI